MALDAYLDEHVFEPLGMVDTGFFVPEDQFDRLCANYLKTPTDPLFPLDTARPERHCKPPRFLSGAGGLVSTLDDYLRFCRALLGGGELDGERVLGTKTLQYMATNHLPGGVSLNELGLDTFSEVVMEGMGFGLGVSVLLDPAIAGAIGNVGEYGWGGAAATVFWIDPVEDLAVVFLTQLVPVRQLPDPPPAPGHRLRRPRLTAVRSYWRGSVAADSRTRGVPVVGATRPAFGPHAARRLRRRSARRRCSPAAPSRWSTGAPDLRGLVAGRARSRLGGRGGRRPPGRSATSSASSRRATGSSSPPAA